MRKKSAGKSKINLKKSKGVKFMKNVIVGQSGGPTAVINSSLLGVFKTARDRGADIVYGMVHG